MSENPILDAALKLDMLNDDHWTGQNLPAINKLNKILSEDGYENVNRADVNEAIPEFTRVVVDEETEKGEDNETQDEEEIKEEDKKEEKIEASFKGINGNITSEEVAIIHELMEDRDIYLNKIENEIERLRSISQKIRREVHDMAAKLVRITPNFSDLHKINRENQKRRIEEEFEKQNKLAVLVSKLEDNDS